MSRAGKPWICGSSSSFIFSAIIGSRAGSMTQSVGMPAVQPSTDRPTSCVAAGLDAGHVEDVAEPHAGPLRVADEVAADLVADAGDRHVLLDDRQLGEVVVGQRRSRGRPCP